MNLSTFSGKRIIWLATGFLLVVATILYSFNINTSSTVNSKNQPQLGTWKVTEVTGFVNVVVKGGSAWCDAVNENYYPIIDDDQTFIKFIEGSRKPKLKNIPMKVFDTLNMVTNPKGIFIFQFGFDNGYESNAVLESYGVPYHYTELIKGLWTFEEGIWGNKAEFVYKNEFDGGISHDKNLINDEIVALGTITSGNKWGGKYTVKVVGHFKGENRIEGQWEWYGVTAGPVNIPECTSKLEGSGNWVAIKK